MEASKEFEKEAKERLEAMYLSALPVRNLETGKHENGQPIEEAMSYHLHALIAAATEYARAIALEAIGEEEDTQKGYWAGGWSEVKEYRNSLRAEQKAELNQLTSGGKG